MQTLLSEGVDVNILDYKGATPLHRAKDAATVEVYTLNLLTITICSFIVYITYKKIRTILILDNKVSESNTVRTFWASEILSFRNIYSTV